MGEGGARESRAALWTTLAVQPLQHFFPFKAPLLLRAEHLVPFQAIRMELAVPIGRKCSATPSAKVLSSSRRLIAVHKFTPNGVAVSCSLWRSAITRVCLRCLTETIVNIWQNRHSRHRQACGKWHIVVEIGLARYVAFNSTSWSTRGSSSLAQMLNQSDRRPHCQCFGTKRPEACIKFGIRMPRTFLLKGIR